MEKNKEKVQKKKEEIPSQPSPPSSSPQLSKTDSASLSEASDSTIEENYDDLIDLEAEEAGLQIFRVDDNQSLPFLWSFRITYFIYMFIYLSFINQCFIAVLRESS